jgi:hypothetical protein
LSDIQKLRHSGPGRKLPHFIFTPTDTILAHVGKKRQIF